MRRLSLLLPCTLLLVASCGDTPTDPAETGPIQMNVVAATTAFVPCGQEIPVTATATDARTGRPLPNYHVNFNVLAGGGSMFGGAGPTDRHGQIRDYWTVANGANVSNTLAVRAVNPTTGTKNTYFTQTVTTLSKIAFTSNRDGNYEIYVMNADGSNPTNLTNHWADDSRPAWSPDGSKITFTSNQDVYVMNANGSNPMNLTNNSAYEYDASPAWSPDGSKITFRRGHTDHVSDDDDYGIYVMNVDGSNPTHLTNNLGAEAEPAWSPDGSKIAFASFGRIVVMNTNGSNQISLTNNASWDYSPAWSPDGSKITFRSYRDSNWEIYVMNADGSNPTRMTNYSGSNLWPDWSGCTAP